MSFPARRTERLGGVEEPGIDILDGCAKCESSHRHDVMKQAAGDEKLDVTSAIWGDAQPEQDRPQRSGGTKRKLERIGSHQHAEEHEGDETADDDFAPARRQAPRDPIGERKCQEDAGE